MVKCELSIYAMASEWKLFAFCIECWAYWPAQHTKAKKQILSSPLKQREYQHGRKCFTMHILLRCHSSRMTKMSFMMWFKISPGLMRVLALKL